MATISENAKTENRRLYPGAIINIRVTTAESNNSIVIADFEAIPGSEPPRHVHSIEDEIFIIKEGTVTFYLGDDVVHANAGDITFMPRNVPHHFSITSDKVKATVMATPGHIENFFRSLSVPYDGIEIPPLTPPTEEQKNFFISQTETYGMRFV